VFDDHPAPTEQDPTLNKKVENKATKAVIMSAALDILGKEGFEKATMRSIADKANVTTSIIYRHFKNKDDLVITLLSTIIQRTSHELNMYLAGLTNTKTKIYRMTKYYLNFFQNNIPIAQLVYASTNLGYWYENRQAYQTARESGTILTKIIQEGQKSGDLRDDLNLFVTSHMYYGALRYLIVSWLYNRNSYQLSDLARQFTEGFYGGISSINNETELFFCPVFNREKEAVPAKPLLPTKRAPRRK
jgi:AcrR family transcriptional regulator